MIIPIDPLQSIISEFLKDSQQFKLNEKLLEFVTKPIPVVGDSKERDHLASTRFYMQQGMLMMWEYIQSLAEPVKEVENEFIESEIL